VTSAGDLRRMCTMGNPGGVCAGVVGLRGSSAAVCPDLSLPARGRTIVTGDSRDSVVWIPMLRPCPVRVNSGCAGQAAARQVNPNKQTPELEQTYLAIRHPQAG
jgi:hypothetical protein